jgi:hypothetical protein
VREIRDGLLYDTEDAVLVHRTEQRGLTPEHPGGGWTQSLYETASGRFFYVYTHPHAEPYLGTFDDFIGGYKDLRECADNSQEACAMRWLERHKGAEVILERWPERVTQA